MSRRRVKKHRSRVLSSLRVYASRVNNNNNNTILTNITITPVRPKEARAVSRNFYFSCVHDVRKPVWRARWRLGKRRRDEKCGGNALKRIFRTYSVEKAFQPVQRSNDPSELSTSDWLRRPENERVSRESTTDVTLPRNPNDHCAICRPFARKRCARLPPLRPIAVGGGDLERDGDSAQEIPARARRQRVFPIPFDGFPTLSVATAANTIAVAGVRLIARRHSFRVRTIRRTRQY